MDWASCFLCLPASTHSWGCWCVRSQARPMRTSSHEPAPPVNPQLIAGPSPLGLSICGGIVACIAAAFGVLEYRFDSRGIPLGDGINLFPPVNPAFGAKPPPPTRKTLRPDEVAALSGLGAPAPGKISVLSSRPIEVTRQGDSQRKIAFASSTSARPTGSSGRRISASNARAGDDDEA